MKRVWPLVALGIGAYVLFALVTLPATAVLPRFAPLGVQAAGISGTAWNGRAQVVRIGGAHLGGMQWRVRALQLFAARLSADVKLIRLDGFAQTGLTLTPAGRVSLDGLTASLPMSAVPPSVIPPGWGGTVNARFQQLAIEDGWPVAAEGTLEIANLVGPPRKPTQLGGYKITFPADPAAQPDTLTGAVSDTGGPLQVTGTLKLDSDRSYVVDGLIAPRPDAPGEVTKALEYLEPPDAQGRRPFSFAGTL